VHSEIRDADGVRAFYQAHVHPNVLEPLLAAPGKRYVVLVEAGAVVAAVSLQRRALRVEQVGGILVAPHRRGEGLTRLLLPAAFAEARAQGSRFLVGGVYRRAPDVSRLYRALGFRTVVPYIPGAASWGPLGWLARSLARCFRVEAGPDAIRIMGGRVKKAA